MTPIYGLLFILVFLINLVSFVIYMAYIFDDFHFGYMDYDDLGNNIREVFDTIREFPIALLILILFTAPMFILIFVSALIVYTLNLTPFQK